MTFIKFNKKTSETINIVYKILIYLQNTFKESILEIKTIAKVDTK